MTRLQHIRHILWGVLLLNFFVALAKWGYGHLTYTLSMQADGLHSFFDGVSNIVGLVGIRLATKPPDDHHPYGHKKFEALAAASIGSLLVATCLFLLWKAYVSWTSDVHPQVTLLSFVVMILTISINLFVTHWERRKGQELKSEILIADSYHTASDVLASLSVLGGLFAVQAGYPFIDPLITVFIAVIIAWTAYLVLQDVLASFTDRIRLDPQQIRSVVMTLPGVLKCHNIRTRGLAHHVFVDLSIHLDPKWSIQEGHQLATQVEDLLTRHFDAVEDVVVHIEPEGHERDEEKIDID